MPETLTPAEAFVDEALSEAIFKAVNYKAWDCPEDSLVVSPYFNVDETIIAKHLARLLSRRPFKLPQAILEAECWRRSQYLRYLVATHVLVDDPPAKDVIEKELGKSVPRDRRLYSKDFKEVCEYALELLPLYASYPKLLIVAVNKGGNFDDADKDYFGRLEKAAGRLSSSIRKILKTKRLTDELKRQVEEEVKEVLSFGWGIPEDWKKRLSRYPFVWAW
jgi:hypothetical protein